MTDSASSFRLPITLVRSVCLRPGMYTLGGSFEEVVCLLQGLFSGEAHLPSRTSAGAELWFELTDRLRRDLAVVTGGGWQAGFEALRRRCAGNQEALERLADLYDEMIPPGLTDRI